MQDNTKSVKPTNVPGSPTRAATRTRARTWASEDVLPALSGRASELAELARTLQADLDRTNERLAAYSEFDGELERALIDTYEGAQEILGDARGQADATLERALDERRIVLKERDRLHAERDDLTNGIAVARRARLMPMRALPEPDRTAAADYQEKLAAEVRVILRALLREALGPRPTRAPPKVAVRPPHTLLRSPVRAALQHPVRRLPREVAPARTSPTIAEPIVEELSARDPVRAGERSETIAPIVTWADVIETAPAVTETHADLNETRAVTGQLAPTRDEAETSAITRSDDLRVATEPDPPVTSELSVEPDETIEDPRAIAVELVEAASAAAYNMLETGADLPIELTQVGPTLTVPELSEERPGPMIREPIDASVPLATEENVEQVTPPPTTRLVDTVLPARIEAAALTDLWDTALDTTEQTEIHETADASLASPFETIDEPAIVEAEPVISEPQPALEAVLSDTDATLVPTVPEPAVAPLRAARELQLVLSPIMSFPQLLAIQHRIASLSSVTGIHLRDFRNGVATFAVGVTDALSGREFGSVLQMLVDLHLRLEGATESAVELRVEAQTP